jgi:hypothetical protein
MKTAPHYYPQPMTWWFVPDEQIATMAIGSAPVLLNWPEISNGWWVPEDFGIIVPLRLVN